MKKPPTCSFNRRSQTILASAALLLSACSAASDGAPVTPAEPASVIPSASPAASESASASVPVPAVSAAPPPAPSAWSPPEAVFGDWHEDQKASTEGRTVFVPKSVNLGLSRFRRTLHLGQDKSFSTLRLAANDAHTECAGTFAVAGPNVLSAQCSEPKKSEVIKITLEILEASKDRLVVKITP